jgi:hypothetical protein
VVSEKKSERRWCLSAQKRIALLAGREHNRFSRKTANHKTIGGIGHGNRTPIEQHEKWQKESSDQFDEIGSSMNRAFVNFYQRTYKDVDRAMAHHAEFFKHLKHLDEILVIGHSVNIIDMPYYIKIHKNNSTVTWNVYYHRDSEKTEMESALKGIGITNLNMIPAKDFWDQ